MATIPVISPEGRALDLSAGFAAKPPEIDLSSGLRPVHVDLPGASKKLIEQAQSDPAIARNAQRTEFEKEHSSEGQPGYLESLGDNLLNKVESVPRIFSGMGGINAAKHGAQAIENDQARKDAGRDLPYRVAAYTGDLLGIANAPAQEREAEHGNMAGVAGQATGDVLPAAVPVASEIAHRSGVVPRIAEGVSALRDAAAESLKEGATRQYGRVLAPSKQANKFLAEKKVIPEAIRRGIVARSGKALEENAADQAQVAGQAVDDAVDALPRQPNIATKPILDHLEAYKQEFINQVPVSDEEFGQLAANGKPVNILADGTKVKEVNLDPEAVERVNQMQQIIQDHGDLVDYQSLRKAKQVFDEKVARANGYAGKTLSEGTAVDVKREAANAIRRELAKDNPDIARLNAEYSFWENLRKVSADTNQRRVGQQGGGLTRKIAQGTGAGVGAIAAGPKGALIGAALGKRMSQLFNSTAWQSVSAVTKNKLADLLSTGDAAGAGKLLQAPKSLKPWENIPQAPQSFPIKDNIEKAGGQYLGTASGIAMFNVPELGPRSSTLAVPVFATADDVASHIKAALQDAKRAKGAK